MPAKVVSTVVADKLLDKGGVIRPVDVIGEMKSTYGMEILYNKAWKVREYAQNLVYGDPLDSFKCYHRIFICLSNKIQER